jgi:hypothetical protein
MNYDLSILIPARNELFVSNTVEDILKNRRGKTEIIVGLDGAWADPGIAAHPDVRVIYVSESLGQRAMTNLLARLSQSKYVAKCDAHVAFSEGFDVELMAAMEGHDNWTIVPTMKNLHAFDWVCPDGHRRYQGPSGPCTDCGKPTERDVVWYAKPSPNSNSFCFDSEPHFQYFGDWNKRPEGSGDITPTMSLQGSFFMLTRDKYWELNICDEEFGSWGSQGIEVAVKTWLSGGEVMVDQKCWYAHLFRTQGGDFGFPYPISGKQVSRAKAHAKQLFFENGWPQQTKPLSWLLEKFWPVKGWTDADLAKVKQFDSVVTHEPSKGIIYYTTNKLPVKLAKRVQNQIKSAHLPIVSVSLKPMDNMGKNIHVKREPGIETYFTQIVVALEASTAEIVFFTEHDVLYDRSHFDFIPPSKDKFYYNTHVWRVRADGKAVTWEANQVAELCCYRELALGWYRKKLAEVQAGSFNRSYEPGGRDTTQYGQWCSDVANIDIRHGENFTKSKWSPDDFRDKSTCVNWQESTASEIPGRPNLGAIL